MQADDRGDPRDGGDRCRAAGGFRTGGHGQFRDLGRHGFGPVGSGLRRLFDSDAGVGRDARMTAAAAPGHSAPTAARSSVLRGSSGAAPPSVIHVAALSAADADLSRPVAAALRTVVTKAEPASRHRDFEVRP